MLEVQDENVLVSDRPPVDLSLFSSKLGNVVLRQAQDESKGPERAANDLSLTQLDPESSAVGQGLAPLAHLVRGNDLPTRTVSLLSGLDAPSRQASPDYLLLNADRINQLRAELARQ